jgi:hypothetical protein
MIENARPSSRASRTSMLSMDKSSIFAAVRLRCKLSTTTVWPGFDRTVLRRSFGTTSFKSANRFPLNSGPIWVTLSTNSAKRKELQDWRIR